MSTGAAIWKLKNPHNETTEWLFDSAGRLSQRKLHNGTSETVAYDNRSRVSTITLKDSAQTVLRHHVYGYDDASNVTSHTVGGVTTSYTYDLAYQLESETRTGYSCSYTYDPNGNRLTRTLNGTTETYANDAADKLTSITVGGNVVRSFTYDNLGRRKTDTVAGVGTTNYTWDQESRLIGYGANASYSYNAFDTRVSKTVSGTTTSYRRGGAGVTDPVLSETTSATTTAYTPGISEKRGSNPTEYLHSGMKNADARTSGQTVDATRQYDAFGNLTGSSGTWNGPFGYAGGFGYQEDAESGLKLLGHRYYDPTTGRFLSKDPASSGRNWYVYAGSNPINRVDPLGLDWMLFDGDTLYWYDDNNKLLRSTPAYSGMPGTTSADQRDPKRGPIPEGEYYIDPSEDAYATWNVLAWPGAGYKPSAGWGDRRIPIHPAPGTATLGRGGFFLHGGAVIGSAGCIDIGSADIAWIDRIGKKKTRIKLIVKYKKGVKVPGGPPATTGGPPTGIPWSKFPKPSTRAPSSLGRGGSSGGRGEP